MKFTVPAIAITALVMAAPANAQYGTGTVSTPGASITKDNTWSVATRVNKHVASHKQKKHMASYKQHRHATTTSSKEQTTGSNGSSTDKHDTKSKSQ